MVAESNLDDISREVMERYRKSFSYIDLDSVSSDEDWIGLIKDILELAEEVRREG